MKRNRALLPLSLLAPFGAGCTFSDATEPPSSSSLQREVGTTDSAIPACIARPLSPVGRAMDAKLTH